MATIVSTTSCGSGSGKSKTLIVYYSRTGNTENVANQIQVLTGADMFRVEAVKLYPEDYNEILGVTREERQANARPEIKGGVDNIADYDTIFIGYPIWWGTHPMAIATFLESHDLSGKVVIPFATHGGDGFSRSFPDVYTATPDSEHLDGLGLLDREVPTSGEKIKNWLKEVKVIE